jgi:prevent-host-death family protein
MKKVTTHQAKTQLSQLIKEACEGTEIIVCRGNLPMVRLVPVQPENFRCRPNVGEITSAPISYADNVFDPLTDDELTEWGL